MQKRVPEITPDLRSKFWKQPDNIKIAEYNYNIPETF